MKAEELSFDAKVPFGLQHFRLAAAPIDIWLCDTQTRELESLR